MTARFNVNLIAFDLSATKKILVLTAFNFFFFEKPGTVNTNIGMICCSINSSVDCRVLSTCLV